jgi:hypothetical protein
MYDGFEVFTAVRMMMFFWVLAPCGHVGRCQRFGETLSIFRAEDGDSMFLFRDEDRDAMYCNYVDK